MAYFNRVANMRHGINTIHSLIISEGRTIIGEDIKIHIYEYFRQIFGLSESMRIRFLKKIWAPQINLCQSENDFSEEVVKKAIWDLGQNKATGPDDFPIFFFRIFWSSIKQDLLNLLRKMNRGTQLDRLNYSFVTFIPKNNPPKSICEYRPIALLNSVLKIFSTVLASRLTPYLQEMIGDTQMDFIARRNILDNVAIAQEIIHQYRKTGKQGYILKLDF